MCETYLLTYLLQHIVVFGAFLGSEESRNITSRSAVKAKAAALAFSNFLVSHTHYNGYNQSFQGVLG